jgi:nitrogen fixation protein NifB
MNMMRHCRQCRADAVGLLGEDRSKEFSQQNLETMQISDEDQETRRVYREFVEVERAAKLKAREEEMATVQDLQETAPVLLAVATKGGGRINEHFGHAKEFQIYEASANGVHFVGHRRVDLYCQGGYGEEDALDTVIKALADCQAVFVAKIGSCPKETLQKAGIEAIDAYAFEYIDKALLAYFKDYAEKVQSGIVKAGAQKDALIRQGAYSA